MSLSKTTVLSDNEWTRVGLRKELCSIRTAVVSDEGRRPNWTTRCDAPYISNVFLTGIALSLSHLITDNELVCISVGCAAGVLSMFCISPKIIGLARSVFENRILRRDDDLRQEYNRRARAAILSAYIYGAKNKRIELMGYTHNLLMEMDRQVSE
jgi:hypothetical protein